MEQRRPDADGPPTTEPESERRTLAQAIGRMSDAALMALFAERPDLVRFLPGDLGTLAQRCASPLSLRLIWHRITRLEQQVLEVMLAHRGLLALSELSAAMDPDGTAANALLPALERLRGLALVWGADDGLHCVTALAAQVGPDPCGLDSTDRSHVPHIRRYMSHPAELFDELATAPADARAALDRLVWGPPRGRVPNANRAVSAATAATPVEWLLARDLLVAAGPETVVLPREIALLLRNGRYIREVALPPGPPVVAGAAPLADADAAAGMRALQSVRAVARLLVVLAEGRTRLLRSGGVYQRDAAELARRLHLTYPQTALLADVAHSAGLIDAGLDAGAWGLTRSVDAWQVLPEPRQWAILAIAWRDSISHTSLAASGDADNRILSDTLHAPSIAEIRRLALRLAATAPPSVPIDADHLVASIGWSRPRLHGRDLPSFVAEILVDGDFLGVFGRGALSSAGRLLADGRDPAIIGDAVRLPALVEKVVLQADLTATAMGPMTPQSQSRIGLLADVESSGAGTVHRITAATLGRAFDAGMSTGEVLAELSELSVTDVPATLAALVQDVGRRHGSIRVQPAGCVVIADDEAALAAALADKTLAHLRLQRVAPGVAVSTAGADVVTTALRQAGLPALPPVDARAAQRRRLAPRPPVVTEHPDHAQLQAAVRAIRAGEAAREALQGKSAPRPAGPHELVEILTAAARDRTSVWLDYSDGSGTRTVRLVEPLTVRGGLLSAFDQREQRVTGFPLSRIAGISVVPDPGAPPTS